MRIPECGPALPSLLPQVVADIADIALERVQQPDIRW
jgi:hypothetical protein